MVTYEWVSVTLPVKCVSSWIANASSTRGNYLKLYSVQSFGTSECTISSTDIDTSYFSYYAILKILKNELEFETCAGFFPAGMKAHWNESGGGILLGDNTGGGAVMLRPIRCGVFEPGFQLDLLLYVYICSWPYADYTQCKIQLATDFPGRYLLRELRSVCSFPPSLPMFAFSHYYSIFNLMSLRLLVNVAWNFCEPTRGAHFHRHYEEAVLSRGGVSVWQRPGRLSSSCNLTSRARLARNVSCLWTPLEAHYSCNRIQRYPKAFSSKQLWVAQLCRSHLLCNKKRCRRGQFDFLHPELWGYVRRWVEMV